MAKKGELDERVTNTLARLPFYKSEPDGSFQQAYHALQNAPDLMNDDVFMFEAGKRSARLEIKRELYSKATKAIRETLDRIFKV